MASIGNIVVTKGIPQPADAFVVLVKTEWNAHLVDRLEQGAVKVLDQAGIRHETIVVPGAVELPFAVQRYYNELKNKADAFIALGTVIQGGTPHFEYVCQMVSEGISSLNLTLTVPVIFGVLTLNNEQEAIERTGGKHGHKGEEAAITALKMIALNRALSDR